MSFAEICFLAFALAVDAIVASFSYGLIIRQNRRRAALKLATATGVGQFIMPVLGWYGAQLIYHQIAAIDHWIAFAVFTALGLKVIYDAQFAKEDTAKRPALSLKILLLIGIATSIDAFVSGCMLYFVQEPIWSAAAFIGGTTFVLAFAAFDICRLFKNFSPRLLETSSGIILIALGCKILFEHLS